MRVVGTPEFLDCMAVAKSDKDKATVQELIESLRDGHESAAMRATVLSLGSEHHLFATRPILLSSREFRITWQYDERDGEEVVLCYTLAEIVS